MRGRVSNAFVTKITPDPWSGNPAVKPAKSSAGREGLYLATAQESSIVRRRVCFIPSLGTQEIRAFV